MTQDDDIRDHVRATNLDATRPLPPGCWVLLVVLAVVVGWALLK